MITLILPDASASFVFFADLAFKATVLLLLAWCLSLVLPRLSAASRHVLWVSVAATLLLLPFLETVLPDWRLAVLPSETVTVAQAERPAAEPQAEAPSPAVPASAPGVSSNEPPVGSSSPALNTKGESGNAEPFSAAAPPEVGEERSFFAFPDWRMGIVGFWLAGSLFLLALVGLAHLRLTRLVGKTRRVVPGHSFEVQLAVAAGMLGVERAIDIRIAGKNRVPFTCGLWRPVIVLPEEAEAWPEERLRAVLLHELAHVKRRDCFTQFLAQVCVALYWFHPLAWHLSRQMRMEREKACDDLVLNAGVGPTVYGQTLLTVAAQRVRHTGAPYAALAMAKKSSLEGRLLAILDAKRNRRGLTRVALAAGLVLCGIVAIPVASVRLAAKEPASFDSVAGMAERNDELRLAAIKGTLHGNLETQRAEASLLLRQEQLEPAARLLLGMSATVESVFDEIESEETWTGEPPEDALALLPDLSELLITLDLALDALDEGAAEEALDLLEGMPFIPLPAIDPATAESWDAFVMGLHETHTEQLATALRFLWDERPQAAFRSLMAVVDALARLDNLDPVHTDPQLQQALILHIVPIHTVAEQAGEALEEGDEATAVALLEAYLQSGDVPAGRGPGPAFSRERDASGETPEDPAETTREQTAGASDEETIVEVDQPFNETRLREPRETLRMSEPVEYEAGQWTQSISLADLNNNGRLDVMTANRHDHEVMVRFGTGDGAFGEPAYYRTGREPVFVRAVDLTGNGTLDLITANRSHTVSVLLGTGDGTFGDAATYRAGEGAVMPLSIAVADFTGDGNLDLATANFTGNSVSLLRGNGDGVFGDPVQIGVGDGPISIVTGDFNANGHADLAVANRHGNTATVLLGNGNGEFSRSDYQIGSRAGFIVAGDLSRNGAIDLAVANYSDSSITLLRGDGAGGFSEREIRLWNVRPSSLALADMNGDGRLDIVTTSHGSGTPNAVAVLLAGEDATFSSPPRRFRIARTPDAIAAGDLDGDGFPDIVTANVTQSSISVFLSE